MKRVQRFLLAVAMVSAPAVVAAATVALHDRAQLAAALDKGPPCCVIDARPAGTRALRPLPDALVYRTGMKINPTAAVVVIADTDQNAVRVGEELARTNNVPTVIAVKGGLATWDAAAGRGGPPGGAPLTFVIPKNTCEQEAPLQQLRTEPH